MTKLRACLLACAVFLMGHAHNANAGPQGGGSISGWASLTTKGYQRPCEAIALVRVTEETSKGLSPLLGAAGDGYAGIMPFRAARESIPNYDEASQGASCDANGTFAFKNVPDGDYFLVARVTWLLGHAHRGGFVIHKVAVFGAMEGIKVHVTLQ